MEVPFVAVSVLHVLEVVAAATKPKVALDTHKSLFGVLIDKMHAHCCRLFVVTMIAALRTVDMITGLLISINLLGITRFGVRGLYCLHD